MMQKYEQKMVHPFLTAFDDDAYSSFRSQMLMLDPLPSLDRILNMAVQDESNKSLLLGHEDKSENVVAFAVLSRDRGKIG